jgi:hypothetical protein
VRWRARCTVLAPKGIHHASIQSVSLSVLLLMSLILPGCETMGANEKQGALIGAVAGS